MDGAEEDTDSEVEEYSGMEQPPLIKQLKTILAEYPDDGQIIKELVQNAEDAEASEMKILYDGRTINTATMKKLPYRKFFKAPALCFYNNEVFSETDWRGIKMIYSSVKEEDPLKVGRFGLGFKSVFHITDNPCIISGNKILLMNPHEKVPDKVCITMKLKDLKKCKRMNVEEFLLALMGTFGFSADALNSGNYNGTLFWFPLRETPSELSDTCYDQGKVLDLFKSYQTEAIHSLLFLKSLRNVELCSRCSGTAYDLPDGQEFFSVELSDGDGLIKEGRSKFLREIKDTAGKIPDTDIICVAQPKFKTCFRNADMLEVEETERSWLVINVYKGGNMSEKLTQLVSDRELSYSPYVGAAVLLSDCGEPFKGHVFCFLPLPQENKSLTGLPIHFNGFFALSQNRRHLKWASADQETLHMHRDKAILWNECLVNEVLPEVYMLLIKEMITISGNSGNNEEAVEAVYKCIPAISAVDDKWSGCVKSLYQQLLHTDIVFLPNHSKWVQPLRPLYTVFDQQNILCDKKETVIKTLNQYKNVETTTVPIHVWKLLRKIAAPKDITPSELCKIMRSDGIYKRALEASEKLKLLEYITKDKELELLKGLELLPVEQGSFVTFQETGSRPSPVYFCTKEEILMFPGLEDTFISTEISTSLEYVMRELATSGRYHVKCLTITDTVSLLEITIRQELGKEEPIVLRLTQDNRFAKWIENVWVYIFKHYSSSLLMFENLPLIPCLISDRWDDRTWRNEEVHLYTMNRSFILKSGMGIEDCPNGVLKALTYLSVIVLPSLPEWFDAGKFNCIFNPTGASLLRLLDRLQSSNVQTIINCFNNNCKESETEALVTLLARISSPLTDSIITFLRKLHLFKQCTSLTDASATVTSVTGNSQIVNFSGSFPIRFPQPLLVPSSNSSLCLAKTLRAKEINEEQLVIEVLKAINSGSYRNEEVRTFMMWFLTNIHKFQWNENVMSHAKNVSFVPNGISQCKPSELYDPRDANMLSLFQGENKFPVDDYASEVFLNAMHHLGLKKKQDISANCLHTTAKELDRMCTNGLDTEDITQKAKALFEIFEERVAILQAYVTQTSTQLQTSICHLKCILHKRETPASYPKDLVWKGSEFTLCSPSQLKSDTFSNTVGSVIPLVWSTDKLGQIFQWNKKPGPKELTEQLVNIITAYSSINKPDFLPLISNVNRAMAEKASELINCHEFQRLLQKDSIWWGDGFCSPSQIILDRQNTDIELQPYMYPVPTELQSLQAFYFKIGCHRKQDTNALLSVQDMIARKHQTCGSTDESQTRKDLNIVLQILNKLFQEKDNATHLGERLLFPVHTGDDRTLVLKSYSQCTYCDTQWLKELTDEDDEDEDIIYVHGDVPSKVAEGLGVKSLKKQLMSDAEGLEEWGQEEPLTRRLHNILKDGYVDGLAVPKEIIQNADDARATTVQFLYDERENTDARTQLLDEGMAECQGPALWAYNDALFSNEDLKNIIKLSGATKETDTTKIGKFGLGFCAVYNLTDVPSFVSGQNMVLFDPHTKYLNKALPGKSPGLKINLQKMKNKRLMKRMNNQFKPFQNVFDCDFSQQEPFYNGTLFRLPLRTPQQAGVSEIKNTAYPKEEIVTLLNQFVEASGNMLLFTQHLQEIKLFHIPAVGVTPQEAKLLCTVSKESVHQTVGESMLAICSNRKISKSLHCKPFTNIQKLVVTLKCETPISVFGNIKAETWETHWLVSWATGTSRSLELCYSTSITGALPLGSVAMLLESGSGCLAPKSLKDAPFGFYKTGHVFCYLPLPVQSKLDVHLNGSFAVASNRRGLQTNTEDDKYSYDTQWNDALLSDAVAQAFVNLLVCVHECESVQYRSLSTDYKFFQEWPTSCSPVALRFKKGFYKNVIASNGKVFESYTNWLGLKQCIFFQTAMSHNSEIWEIVLSTLQRFRPSTTSGVVNLPSDYFDELQSTVGWKDNSNIVGEQDFFLCYFLPNISDTYWQDRTEHLDHRNKLLLYCLEHSNPIIDATLKELACIPTSHDGTLRKPRDLVHPDGRVSMLFSTEDGRFPDKSFSTYTILCKLLDLGMMKDSLEADLIIERTVSISNLSSEGFVTKALERCKHVIGYLASCRELQQNVLQRLKDVKFLPVLRKPDIWPFKWEADKFEFRQQRDAVACFNKPCNLFFDDCKDLVACTEILLDSRVFPYSMYNTSLFVQLGVKTKANVTLGLVVEQLLGVCSVVDITTNDNDQQVDDQVLDKIYRFLDEKAALNIVEFRSVLPCLKDMPIISLESELLPVSKVAFSVGHRCTPELYEIGKNKISKYRKFLESVGVKKNFDIQDVVQILQRKKTEIGISKLPQNEFQLIRQLLELLSDIMQQSQLQFSDITQFGEENIVAPDIDMILRPTYMLCLDDHEFEESSASMRFVHSDVSRTVAENLGISTKKRKYLQDCSIGDPFEQKEELVTRLKGLLNGYPCDIGIMKELIQNADDANATEVHFVKDFRTHSCEKIFDSSYKEFQGPALLVYNDSPFSQADLKGIRSLGVGSKNEDPAKTGQYGVGFNAVYNFTDIPSFITKGPEIEGGETLCLFDPTQKHCRGVTGVRYNTAKVRNAFPDVLSGYSEESVFGGKATGTVFRFPLRQSKSDTCISDTVVTKQTLNEIMDQLKSEMQSFLFFLRSVTKIIVSDISSGSLMREHSVSVSLNDSDAAQRKHFSVCCKERAKQIKETRNNAALYPPLQIAYELQSRDNSGREQKWFVVQRLGVSGDSITEQVKNAFQNGELGMLPVGGVALRIPQKRTQRSVLTPLIQSVFRTMAVTEPLESGRIYCFLPLPMKTGLPMHIHGHFILDHEARRSLWSDEKEGYKSSWNLLLLSDVVAHSYVQVLKFLKTSIFAEDNTEGYSKQSFNDHLELFDTYFPNAKKAQGVYETSLVKCVFQTIIKEQEELFPIRTQRQVNETDKKSQNAYSVKWSSFHPDDHQFPVHFVHVNNFPFSDSLDDILIALNFKLTSRSSEVIQSMLDSGCPILQLNPTVVTRFLKSYSSAFTDRIQLGTIPCPVSKTKFDTVRNVGRILHFCSKAETFLNDLNGLPLLVTNDGILRCFDTSQIIYCTKYCSLLRKSASKFVHTELVVEFNSINICEKSGVKRDICLTRLEDFLTSEIDKCQYTQADHVEVDPSLEVPGTNWIKGLWKLIVHGFENTQNGDDHDSFDTYIRPLQNWCLIPALQNDRVNVLVKVNKAYSILDMESFGCCPSLAVILRKLGLPILNRQCVPDEAIESLVTCIASSGNPVTLLVCLKYYREIFRTTHLGTADSSAILNFFSDNLEKMQKTHNAQVSWIRDSLKLLPIFLTHAGTYVSVEGEAMQVLVLPSGIPTDGITEWAIKTNRILLQEDSAKAKIHNFLQFSFTATVDVYLQHILKSWDFLPLDATGKHLKYIRENLLRTPAGQKYNQRQTQLIESLKTLAVIPQNNRRRKASDFYSPHNAIFRLFCSAQDFPPEDFSKPEWKEFLKLIGIRTDVTDMMFIQFAAQVALEGSRGLTENVNAKSSILVEYLMVNPLQWTVDVYKHICHIKFVVPYLAQNKYTNIHKQCTENENLICFENSISYRHEQLSWTSLPLLPSEADPYSSFLYLTSEADIKQKENVLGIHHKPTLDSVVKHCQNVCDSLSTCLMDSRRKGNICVWLQSFMERLYNYLQANALTSDISRKRLYHTPVVYIPNLQSLVPAYQTVITIFPNQEIVPYLVKAPIIYGKFSDLFTYLGAAERPTYMLYVNVLARIKDGVRDNVLDDKYIPEWCAISAALDNLFNTLKTESPVTAPPKDAILYLPSRGKQLLPSSLVIVSDNVHKERRLRDSVTLQYFIGFRELQLLQTNSAISSLPKQLRPTYLTQIIKEEIDMSEMREVENSQEAGQLEHFLQSTYFIQGVLRLLKHAKTRRSETLAPEEETYLSSELHSVHVQAVTGLQTYLYVNGNRVDTSVEAKRSYFHNKDGQWLIYFQNISRGQEEWLIEINDCLIRFINRLAGTHLRENVIEVFQLIHMLDNPGGISLLLDRMNIDAYDLPQDILFSVFPPPGTYVPVELHHLLSCEFSAFGVHEYKCVAFELEDAELLDDQDVSDSYSPVYIYVKIVRKIASEETSTILTQLYEIDTGTECITVPAFRLYKLIRIRAGETSNELVSTDGIKPSVSGQSNDKEMYSIRFQLREAWKLNDEGRRHVIKRLSMRWHPDKNLGNEAFSKSMFIYVKECISMLENEIPFDDDDNTDGHFQQARAYPDFTSSQYFSFVERMSTRSHSHGAYAHAFNAGDRTNQRRSAGPHRNSFTHFESTEKVYHDYGEARRWYSQAKVDLRNAVETIDTPGNPPAFNWICYMCHQASEKSLKAAWFSKDANKVPRQSHDLRAIAAMLENDISRCASELTVLVGEHTKMRYPDVLQRPHIPSTVFTRQQAEQACAIARQILNLVEEEYIT